MKPCEAASAMALVALALSLTSMVCIALSAMKEPK